MRIKFFIKRIISLNIDIKIYVRNNKKQVVTSKNNFYAFNKIYKLQRFLMLKDQMILIKKVRNNKEKLDANIINILLIILHDRNTLNEN